MGSRRRSRARKPASTTLSRRCFRADGQPKARLTQEQAEARVRDLPTATAYACPTCGGWHIGRPGDPR